MCRDRIGFEQALKGKTLIKVEQEPDERLVFETTEGEQNLMHHEQECCEGVRIEDICGDLDDLLGTPLLEVEEVSNSDHNPPDADSSIIECQDSFTWTFYKLRTKKGGVTIRWYGESNGYYSESVSFCQL